jgi:BirA family biotin operon repressor/biotin-[acetyl-CoA-carboxylase] ligase
MVVSIQSGLDSPTLLRLLADGRLHSGESLARALGVTRTAVWKAVERLRLQGVEIAATARRGYAMPQAVELLAEEPIRRQIATSHRSRLRSVAVNFAVDSTNTRLLAAPPPPYGSADVLLCEIQHAGRGRRGRQWLAPFGGSLALSLGWSFVDAAHASPTLSLGVGVAVARALQRVGARGVGLKWPNDLWFKDRKLGGILIDVRAEASGPAHVVIGVGINVCLTPAARAAIEASGVRVAAVEDACAGENAYGEEEDACVAGRGALAAMPGRNDIAGAIIDELLRMLADLERRGCGEIRESWQALDVLLGRPAEVVVGDSILRGIARGIDGDGALLLERDGRLDAFMSGDVSLRLGENTGRF